MVDHEELLEQSDAVAAAKSKLRQENETAGFIGLWDYWDQIQSAGEKFEPFVWHWNDVRGFLHRARELYSLEEADRRAFILSNPSVFPKHFTTNTLYVAYQLVGPGEVAAVHRHTPSASRFLLEGDGGYTVVSGEKCLMERGDLIMTPQGTWHDHGNDGTEPVIWVDVLDLPIVSHLGAVSFDFDYGETDDPRGEPIRKRAQTVRHPIGHSGNLYGTANLLPTFAPRQREEGVGTPNYVYRWREAVAALERLQDYPGSPCDGIMLRYVNPIDGGPALPTMDFTVQLLRAGEVTAEHRHTSSTLYCVLEGSGASTVDGAELEWSENDCFVVPSWSWHSHRSNNRARSILYAVSDLPVAEKLSLYREEERNAKRPPSWL